MRDTCKRLAILLALLIVPFGVVMAQTPDGETPAEESVCDLLNEPGITPGLYGLCVAFCEAHDADSTFDEIVCNPSNGRLLENYNKKMGPLDPPMPCLYPECPCWDLERLQIILKQPRPSCSDTFKISTAGVTSFLTYISGKGVEARTWGNDFKKPPAQCYFKDGPKIPISTHLTFEQGLACRNSLLLAGGICFD